MKNAQQVSTYEYHLSLFFLLFLLTTLNLNPKLPDYHNPQTYFFNILGSGKEITMYALFHFFFECMFHVFRNMNIYIYIYLCVCMCVWVCVCVWCALHFG